MSFTDYYSTVKYCAYIIILCLYLNLSFLSPPPLSPHCCLSIPTLFPFIISPSLSHTDLQNFTCIIRMDANPINFVYMQNEGVKIFIQLYKEITLAVDLGSGYALENLKHPNIIVSKVVYVLSRIL